MGFLTKRTVTEVTFMDSLSTNEDIREIRLRIGSEGAGRYFELIDQQENAISLYHPDDFRRLYETALQLWNQGELVPDDGEIGQPDFTDSAMAIQPLKHQ